MLNWPLVHKMEENRGRISILDVIRQGDEEIIISTDYDPNTNTTRFKAVPSNAIAGIDNLAQLIVRTGQQLSEERSGKGLGSTPRIIHTYQLKPEVRAFFDKYKNLIDGSDNEGDVGA